jgi:hypothetical protein
VTFLMVPPKDKFVVLNTHPLNHDLITNAFRFIKLDMFVTIVDGI